MRLSVSLISVGLFFVTFAEGAAETMSGALARAYMGNPDLNQQRAGVRATDETLPQASAAWRPTATATGEYGYNYFDLRTSGGGSAGRVGRVGPEARSQSPGTGLGEGQIRDRSALVSRRISSMATAP